jgi:hypothetical protein
MDFVDDPLPLWYGAVTYEKITRHPLTYGGIVVTLNDMPPPTLYLRNDLEGLLIRRLALNPALPPKSVSNQQWQGGILLIRSK